MYYITTNDNIKIAVNDLNPGGCQTIVMLHGWPLSQAMYEYQKYVLVEKDFRVITIDFRGFGQSDKPAFGYCYDRMADDLYQVVNALNITAFTLVGFSMGGAIALRYMGRYKGYGVNKLVLLAAAAPVFTKRPDSPYGVTYEMVDGLIEQVKVDYAKACEIFCSKMLFARPHSSALKEWLRDCSLEATRLAAIKTMESLRDEDDRGDMACVHVPTAIFHGTKDQVVPYELGVQQHKMIPGSQLFTFENCGHGIFYDDLEKFNRYFIKFICNKK